ncbi:MAG: phosphoglycerate dehydrogenase [Bacteroidota bacterium]
MYKIQTLNKISSRGLEQLPREDYDVATELNNPDAILVRSADMHNLDLGNNLKAIARAGAGVNNIPISKCTEKGIIVFNTPGANANGVKELVIAAMLLASRNIVSAVEWCKTLKGKGDEVPKLVESGKKNFVGSELKGKKLGVIGLGAIGSKVANAAESMGMKVTGYDPFISVEAAWGLSQSVKKAKSLDHLLTDSDYITLNVGLNDKTKNMINEEKFGLMKKGVCIINMARGGLLDNNALQKAIGEGIVSRYVTDFPDDQLLGMDKVIAIPHLGASTDESEENCAFMAVKQVKDFLEKGNIVNSVNFPICEMDMSTGTRILIANKNVPNMVGQITAILAKENLNIADMLNRNKGDFAYNIIDVEKEVSQNIVEDLKSIDGVIMVRVINK